MEQFESVLIETLVVVIQTGIPLAIFFLIGYMIRLQHNNSLKIGY